MRIYLLKRDGAETEITGIVTSVTIRGEYRSCCRSLIFGVIHSEADPETWLASIETGDNIRVTEASQASGSEAAAEEKTLFYGVVWTKSKATDGKELSFTCNDYGVYLKKNKGSYVFNGMTAEAAAAKVCGDFGISVGTLAKTGKPISRNFIGISLYDIIQTMYTLAGEKKYLCIFEEERLSVVEKGAEECTPLESGVNLLTAAVTETLESMVNRVRVYGKEDKLIKEYTNGEDCAAYGFMTEIVRINDSKEDYAAKAEKTLSGLERKITVTNFGGTEYRTGRKVQVREPYTGLIGIFYIDEDEHNWKNGIYTNKLTLNFQNIMDEKEAGSVGK